MRLTAQRARWISIAALVGMIASGLAAAPAMADSKYPSWDDIQNAQANEASKQSEITNVKSLIDGLTNDYLAAQADAQAKLDDYNTALDAYSAGLTKYQNLKQKAADAQTAADASKKKAGALVAQMYRSNGTDVSLQLLLSGGSEAQDLLYKLSTLGQITDTNLQIYQAAVNDVNLANSTANDAQAASDELAKLESVAKDKYAAANVAQQATATALQAQTDNEQRLYQQLASLENTTADLVSAREAGIKKEKEEAAAAKARADELARQQAAAAKAAADKAAQGNSGGSGGSGGAVAPPVSSGAWVTPTYGYVSQPYGVTSFNPFHNGIDIANACGTPIFAVTDGRVVFSGVESFGAQDIVIQSSGVATEYAHMMTGHMYVSAGQNVSKGQHIADMGRTGQATGCHLHFSVYLTSNWNTSMMGTHYNTTDPAAFLRARGVTPGSN